MHPIRRVVPAVFAVFFGSLNASPSTAWTPDSHKAIAASAARLAPPDLHRQITRNRDAYLLGAVDPLSDGQPRNHVENPGGGQLDETIVVAVDNAIHSLQANRPFNEIVYRLGVVAHFVADANNPLATADSDSRESRYESDFRSYLQSTQPRVQITFYGFRHRFDGQRELVAMIDETLERSREHYLLVAREYERIGYRSGLRTFTDRSTAFGVAALAYSHAVSDIAQVLRYIWLAAGGIDIRRKLPVRGQEVVLLPPDPTVR